MGCPIRSGNYHLPVCILLDKIGIRALRRRTRRHVPHELDQGWVNAIKRLGDGTVSTKWGLYGELEVDIAAAAEVSPKTLVKSYTVQIIEGLGLREQIVNKLK